jgi:hypothetical protein
MIGEEKDYNKNKHTLAQSTKQRPTVHRGKKNYLTPKA